MKTVKDVDDTIKSISGIASTPSNDRRLVILYGSQSGCAEEVAARVERGARARRFDTYLMCMDDYDIVSDYALMMRWIVFMNGISSFFL